VVARHPVGVAESALPSGTVTFLFTDVEGSTKLLHELGANVYAEKLAEHRRVVRDACAVRGGVEVDTQGDAFFFAFPSAPDALAAAAAITEEFAQGPITVRIGLHTGTPLITEDGYVGEDVHFAARVAASAHGGQVVLSHATRALIDDRYPLVELGEHRLKDIAEPVAIYQVGDAQFPPLKTISNTNLPRPASSFVGRERELQEVLARIEDGAKLLTLTGPGGTGKTRLALEAAATLVPEYKAGVFWVGLASLRDPALVTETIAQTLGSKDGLGEHIGEREMLLLLDNLEQVIEAAPELSALLRTCPNLTVLVTSRELLRVHGEVDYPVPPLADAEAVSLFCARSQLAPSDEIAELCARLDSLPLAVELAAARTKALTPDQILERLSGRLDLLKGGRDAEARQQTLRATIEWSYDLLTKEEQRLFRALSVFAGGCTLEAAEQVCEADVDTVQSLAEKSLLRFTNSRYWMLETIREYAAERLDESGEVDTFRRRHEEYVLELARSSNLAFDAEGPQRHDLAIAETDNIRAALDWAQASGNVELALETAVALENFWITGHLDEGARRLDAVLQARREKDVLRVRALRVLGTAQLAGRDSRGREILEEGRALAKSLGDDLQRTHIEARLSTDALNRGALDEAEALMRRGLTFYRAVGFVKGEVPHIGQLGLIACERGDVERGLELLVESATRAAEIGFWFIQANMLSSAAYYAEKVGRADDAERWAREALPVHNRIGSREAAVAVLALLARLAAARGEITRVGLLWGAVEAEEARAPLPGWWDEEREDYARPVLEVAGKDDVSRGRRLSLADAVEIAVGGAW
jgi:predicted ATPase/class 3 adenylate cyclase